MPLLKDDPVALTRADLATVATVYRRENKRFNLWGTAALIGGLTLGVVLLTARERLGWPDGLDPIFLFGGWATGLGAALPLYLRRRRAVAGLRLECPNCGAALLGELSRFGGNTARADIVVATGACVECGQQVAAEHGP